MTPHTLPAARSVTMAFVLLAGVTGLMWPKSNMQAQYFDAPKPVPVKTLTFREASPPVRQNAPRLPEWLWAEENPPPPAWTVRPDGLWVPWTLQPPVWLSTIAQGYVVAEGVPMPPERPKDKTSPSPETGTVLSLPPPVVGGGGVIGGRNSITPYSDPQKRMARTPDLCERHGLKKTYTDRYRWRCRP